MDVPVQWWEVGAPHAMEEHRNLGGSRPPSAAATTHHGPGATKGLGTGQAPTGPLLACDTPSLGIFSRVAGPPPPRGMSPALPTTLKPPSKFTHSRSSDITMLVARGWRRGGVTFCF